MTETHIQAIAEKVFGEIPQEIVRKTIGMCNEVYELKYQDESVILRMNKEKEWLYGTHKFLPLFQKLGIKTPRILAEDYSKKDFPFCYQIQNKIEGKDLGLVMQDLSHAQLTGIAKEISAILDKFKSLPPPKDFGGLTGLNEEHHDNYFLILEGQRKGIIERNKNSQVLDEEVLRIHKELLEKYKDYFFQLKPGLYYDDISSKNVMIHKGKFSGLVDLDFLIKGDYLQTLGTMIACWHGEEAGDFYIKEIVRFQNLDEFQQKIIRVYGILNLILWTSEEGIKFNGNSSGEVNWANVEAKRKKIIALYNSIKG